MSLNPMDKIWILLAEYNTLRAEVLAARSNVGQAAGIFFAAIMVNFTLAFSVAKGNPEIPIIIATSLFLYLGFLIAWNAKNTRSFTKRLREIEAQINDLAGDRLLLWETVHGWGGMWGKPNPNFREDNAP